MDMKGKLNWNSWWFHGWRPVENSNLMAAFELVGRILGSESTQIWREASGLGFPPEGRGLDKLETPMGFRGTAQDGWIYTCEDYNDIKYKLHKESRSGLLKVQISSSSSSPRVFRFTGLRLKANMPACSGLCLFFILSKLAPALHNYAAATQAFFHFVHNCRL